MAPHLLTFLPCLQCIALLAVALPTCLTFTTTSLVGKPDLSRGFKTSSTKVLVSEVHIPAYRETKMPFIPTEEDLVSKIGCGEINLEEHEYDTHDFSSMINYEAGHLLHKTNEPVFTLEECKNIRDEAEHVCSSVGWTKNRHGNYPTTDVPIIELPETLAFLRKSLYQRIYPLLRTQFSEFLPDARRLRVADGFIVKYDVKGGQAELKPHRDGSVLSFNIALNSADDFEGGGTWFDSCDDPIKIDEGEMVSHASALLHGGQAITSGIRYILVCFVILEGYDSFSVRFYNKVRNV